VSGRLSDAPLSYDSEGGPLLVAPGRDDGTVRVQKEVLGDTPEHCLSDRRAAAATDEEESRVESVDLG